MLRSGRPWLKPPLTPPHCPPSPASPFPPMPAPVLGVTGADATHRPVAAPPWSARTTSPGDAPGTSPDVAIEASAPSPAPTPPAPTAAATSAAAPEPGGAGGRPHATVRTRPGPNAAWDAAGPWPWGEGGADALAGMARVPVCGGWLPAGLTRDVLGADRGVCVVRASGEGTCSGAAACLRMTTGGEDWADAQPRVDGGRAWLEGARRPCDEGTAGER